MINVMLVMLAVIAALALAAFVFGRDTTDYEKESLKDDR